MIQALSFQTQTVPNHYLWMYKDKVVIHWSILAIPIYEVIIQLLEFVFRLMTIGSTVFCCCKISYSNSII